MVRVNALSDEFLALVQHVWTNLTKSGYQGRMTNNNLDMQMFLIVFMQIYSDLSIDGTLSHFLTKKLSKKNLMKSTGWYLMASLTICVP